MKLFKKFIAVSLGTMMVLPSLAACGGDGETNENNDNKEVIPASALEILEKVWGTYGEDENGETFRELPAEDEHAEDEPAENSITEEKESDN